MRQSQAWVEGFYDGSPNVKAIASVKPNNLWDWDIARSAHSPHIRRYFGMKENTPYEVLKDLLIDAGFNDYAEVLFG